MSSAVEKLQPSHLRPQHERLKWDTDLASLHLRSKTLGKYELIEQMIEPCTVTRTIEGASTVTITVDDTEKHLWRSGMLGSKIDINIDGLRFRLVHVDKQGPVITLQFEDREVALLRQYDDPIKIAWGAATRAKFIRRLVQGVREEHIQFVCPELAGQKRISSSGALLTGAARKQRHGQGFSPKANLLIKGAKADRDQLRNCDTVLSVGRGMILRRKLLVCAIMTGIQESVCRNLTGGDLDSVGFFQQRASWGEYEERHDVAISARKFYSSAIRHDRNQPNMEYAALCQAVQISAHPDAYAQWRTEAEKIVTAWGIAGTDKESASAQANVNAQGNFQSTADGADYEFTRGFPRQDSSGNTTLPGSKWQREDSWDCIQRLADEVHWRAFMRAGAMVYMSEPYMFKAGPIMAISEDDDGIDSINGNYDVGKKTAEVTVTARVHRWQAFPGAVVEIDDEGPFTGRWIVNEISRPVFDTLATITLKKPRPRLPEPTPERASGQQFTSPGTPDAPVGQGIVPVNTKYIAVFPKGHAWPNIISDVAGHRTRPLGNWQSDDAIDFRATAGTPALAVESMRITRVNLNHVNEHGGNIFGAQITASGDSGVDWFYTHLNHISDDIKEGAHIEIGTIIGLVTRWDAAPESSHCHLGSTNVPILQSLVHAPQVEVNKAGTGVGRTPGPN